MGENVKHTLLIFANTGYIKLDRILQQAKEFGEFDRILSKSEKDIEEFVKKHKNFIQEHPYGYGYFIWKPKIIYDTLQDLEENDILVYVDAGTFLNKEGVPRYREYISFLKDEKTILAFSTNDRYLAKTYVGKEVALKYYPDFLEKTENCCYAGLMILRKNAKTLLFLKEWLELCEIYDYLNKNDFDNGLYNLCLSKHNEIVHRIYPDEVNIYIDGLQHVHTNLTNEQIQAIDWSSLHHVPFQVRRMTSKFGYK